jgi:sugar phosphate isomerase/epimerase
MAEALAQRNLKITVLTSDITDADAPLTESVLKTAAELGVRHYRTGYLKYEKSQPIFRQLDQWKAVCRDLAALNAEIGISGVYQNHAGRNYFGAALWDLQRVLEGIDPQHLSVAYDIRHATVEGGMNWPITFRMIRPHVTVVYVKDFRWQDGKVGNVPLGEGQIDPQFFRMLAATDFSGPISLHEEYIDHRQPELIPQHLQAIRRDYDTLKTWLS